MSSFSSQLTKFWFEKFFTTIHDHQSYRESMIRQKRIINCNVTLNMRHQYLDVEFNILFKVSLNERQIFWCLKNSKINVKIVAAECWVKHLKTGWVAKYFKWLVDILGERSKKMFSSWSEGHGRHQDWQICLLLAPNIDTRNFLR